MADLEAQTRRKRFVHALIGGILLVGVNNRHLHGAGRLNAHYGHGVHAAGDGRRGDEEEEATEDLDSFHGELGLGGVGFEVGPTKETLGIHPNLIRFRMGVFTYS